MADAPTRPRPSRFQPPMTPMIDCVFQLLIFFMLTPSLAAGEGFLTTNLPPAGPGGGPPSPYDAIRIRLEAAGPRGEGVAVFLNDAQAFGSNFQGLQEALKDLRDRGLRADYPVLIAPTSATRHKWVVRAFDAVVGARLTHIGFTVPAG